MPSVQHLFVPCKANAELSRGPQGHRFELLVLPERSEGKEFDTAQLRIPPERSEGGTNELTRRCKRSGAVICYGAKSSAQGNPDLLARDGDTLTEVIGSLLVPNEHRKESSRNQQEADMPISGHL